ncbi:MAG: HAD-IIB family hydrolase [Candidatus Taylorbacteria bacterium]
MTAYSKQIFLFSLNGTLASDGLPVEKDIANLLSRLLDNKKLAIISGCGLARIETQLLNSFDITQGRFSNLYILPASGSKMLHWKGSWTEVYSEHLASRQKEDVMVALNASLRKLGWSLPAKSYGSVIQDRGTQISFSGLGENAPANLKRSWDPDRLLREKIVADLRTRIPNYDVRIGGWTSIDITKRGVNKGFGVRKLEELLKASAESMVFIGDAIFSNGNDFPIKATGVDCITVNGPSETKDLLGSFLV